jgi:hypothetical protein
MASRDVVVPTSVTGLGNDAGIVTAIGKQEGQLVVGEKMNL